MGLFGYLLVLGCWKSERCIKWNLLVHRSAIHLDILFFDFFFWKYGKAPRITLSRHSSCISLLGQYLPLIFPTTTSLYGVQGRIRTKHTCILFIVKSKRGSMEKQVMQSRSKGASVWVDGWMDGYDLLLMAFLSRIIPMSLSSSFFLRHGYPFFSFSLFFGHASLACHLFSFWGNHNLTLFYFRDVLRERSPRHGALIMWNEWVVVPIPSVGM